MKGEHDWAGWTIADLKTELDRRAKVQDKALEQLEKVRDEERERVYQAEIAASEAGRAAWRVRCVLEEEERARRSTVVEHKPPDTQDSNYSREATFVKFLGVTLPPSSKFVAAAPPGQIVHLCTLKGVVGQPTTWMTACGVIPNENTVMAWSSPTCPVCLQYKEKNALPSVMRLGAALDALREKP